MPKIKEILNKMIIFFLTIGQKYDIIIDGAVLFFQRNIIRDFFVVFGKNGYGRIKIYGCT